MAPTGSPSGSGRARPAADCVVVGAATPFAPTAYSRARLIRQMHASGLLSGDEVPHAATIVDLEPAQQANGYGAAR